MKQIIDYLDFHVIGKMLFTDELRYGLEDGKLEGIYSDQIAFSNLRRSSTAFSFDMFIVSNEKIYVMDGGAEHGELRKDFSSISLFRFELAKRMSTGQITGFFRFVSGSGREVPAEAVVSGIYDIRLLNGELSWTEDQILYRDQPSREGAFRPVAFKARPRFYIQDRTLRFHYESRSYDVNEHTLERALSKDTIPPFVAAERQAGGTP